MSSSPSRPHSRTVHKDGNTNFTAVRPIFPYFFFFSLGSLIFLDSKYSTKQLVYYFDIDLRLSANESNVPSTAVATAALCQSSHPATCFRHSWVHKKEREL